ncbi:hypothetical protein GCM10009535_11770 [Streptomyces thermocarboxydovorans]|uniref:Uncharacterized protein n=1 Tax=Streptomyces thermocarboxydovorans TaxID=59298 RepID=A0ABN1HBN9_9ACTN
MKLKPIVRPVIHPSGMVVCLPTGLKEFVCSCGGRYTLPSLELPHKTVPGREHLIVVRPTCS